MLNVVREQRDGGLLIRLNGTIEESVDFEKLVGETPQVVIINCKGVPRINSVGVKGWINYFQTLSSKSVKLSFEECSTAIVEQINLISNFTCGGSVTSIYVPFSCETCSTELVGLFKTETLKSTRFKLPELKCTKCGNKAVFDDIPEEYFNFLMK